MVVIRKTVSDLNELVLELEKLPNTIDLVTSEGILEGADLIVIYGKEFCPVRRGDLMRSIRKEREGKTVKIIAGGGAVDYAAYVHEGTSRMPARPFLEQAVRIVAPQIADKIVAKGVERI